METGVEIYTGNFFNKPNQLLNFVIYVTNISIELPNINT